MQKVMVKGLARDEKSLKEAGVVAGSKILVVGSTFDDVLALSQSSTTAVNTFCLHLCVCVCVHYCFTYQLLLNFQGFRGQAKNNY